MLDQQVNSSWTSRLMGMFQSEENLMGYCPTCGAPGITRERRMNGNDKCENGHTYPSKDAEARKRD